MIFSSHLWVHNIEHCLYLHQAGSHCSSLSNIKEWFVRNWFRGEDNDRTQVRMKYLVQRVKLLLEGIIIFWRFLLIPTLGRVSRRKVEKTKFCEKHRFGENIMSAAISFSQAVLDFHFVNAQKRFNLNAAKYILIQVYGKKIVGVCIAFISETQSFRATLTQFLSEWKSLWWR